MEPEIQVATPPVESVPAETGSQEADLSTQVESQVQETGTAQVESQPQSAPRQESGRPRPSEYYKIRQLEKTIRQMSDRFEQLEQKKNAPDPVTPSPKVLSEQEMTELFYSNPVKWALEREAQVKKEFEDKLNQFEQKIPEFISSKEKDKEYQRNSQEALELIFPKSGSENDEFADRVEKNPEKAEAILRILKETGLNEASKVNPVQAAKTVLKLYEIEQKEKQSQRSPNAPTKGQMASTVTAMPQGGGRKMPTVQELQVELQKMNQRVSANPNLFLEKNFKDRWDSLKSELEKISV